MPAYPGTHAHTHSGHANSRLSLLTRGQENPNSILLTTTSSTSFLFSFLSFSVQKLKSQMALSECGHFPASPWVGSGCWHPILPMASSMSSTWHGKWWVGIANLWCLWGGKGCRLLAGRPVATPTWHVWAASVVQTEGAARRILSTAWIWFPVLPIRGSKFFIAESLVHWATSVSSGVSQPIVLG